MKALKIIILIFVSFSLGINSFIKSSPDLESKQMIQNEDLLLKEISFELEGGKLTASQINSSEKYNPLKDNPVSRKKLNQILRKYPEVGEVSMVSEIEPGEKLMIIGKVQNYDEEKTIYVFHTDNRGLYAPEHLRGGHGADNPRLFCYVKPDKEGNFTINTIVPACYPGGSLKHIHYSLLNGQISIAGELIFDEPPYPPSDRQKEWARSNGFQVVKRQNVNGIQTVKVSI